MKQPVTAPAAQTEVQIMGESYVLACPAGSERRLAEAVARVDEAMCQIRSSGKLRARERIAVLAALNLVFDRDTAAPAKAARRVCPPAMRLRWQPCCSGWMKPWRMMAQRNERMARAALAV